MDDENSAAWANATISAGLLLSLTAKVTLSGWEETRNDGLFVGEVNEP
jgi:hypothetical protein